METPKQNRRVASTGIVPPGLRSYSKDEESALYLKYAPEVIGKYADQLRDANGLRLWWLNRKIKCEIETMVAESLHKGI